MDHLRHVPEYNKQKQKRLQKDGDAKGNKTKTATEGWGREG